MNDPNRYYLPSAENSKIVTVTRTGKAAAHIIIQTHAMAMKDTDPETVARFGEVFAFSPNTIIVHQDEPTQFEFWNLQAEMDHDLMLMDAKHDVMMQMSLAKYKKTSYVFTFHRQGVFDFTCSVHLPGMNGRGPALSGRHARSSIAALRFLQLLPRPASGPDPGSI